MLRFSVNHVRSGCIFRNIVYLAGKAELQDEQLKVKRKIQLTIIYT